MLPKILRNFNVFVDGRGYAGKIEYPFRGVARIKNN